MVRGPGRQRGAVIRTDASRAAARLGVAAFGALALLSSIQIYALRRTLKEPISFGQALGYGLGSWAVWALAVPLVLRLGQRFDFAPGRRSTSLAAHLLAMFAIQVPATIVTVLTGLALFSSDEPFPWGELPRQVLAGSRLQFGLLLYAGILGLGRGIDAWTRLRQRELEATRLEAQTVRARLETLAARLQPHFLFNALHTIGALIDEDPVRAREVLTRLGDLLREVLSEPAATEVPLVEELRLLERYTDIERLRFGDRLRVEVAIAPEASGVLVPRFLLQPVVENALRHGIAPLARGGTIRISGEVRSGTLYLVITNNGAPIMNGHREGLGLRTTRERLQTRHGPGATVSLESGADGVQTILALPATPGAT